MDTTLMEFHAWAHEQVCYYAPILFGGMAGGLLALSATEPNGLSARAYAWKLVVRFFQSVLSALIATQYLTYCFGVKDLIGCRVVIAGGVGSIAPWCLRWLFGFFKANEDKPLAEVVKMLIGLWCQLRDAVKGKPKGETESDE